MDSSNLDAPSFFRYTKLPFQVKEYWSTRANAERRKRFEARLNRDRYAYSKPGLITLAFVFAGAGYAAGSQLAECREDIASPQDLFGDMNLFA
jgi:hypothetical protein